MFPLGIKIVDFLSISAQTIDNDNCPYPCLGEAYIYSSNSERVFQCIFLIPFVSYFNKVIYKQHKIFNFINCKIIIKSTSPLDHFDLFLLPPLCNNKSSLQFFSSLICLVSTKSFCIYQTFIDSPHFK